MARAKRTHRTEARRRYRAVRAEIEAAEADGADGAEDDEEAETRSSTRTRASRPPATPSGRLGIAASFRAAMRPLDWRADVRELPRLIRHWSLIVPVLATVASTLMVITSSSTSIDANGQPTDTFGTVSFILYQFFVVPPPMAAAFLAGLGAPRASWLIGAIVGVVAAFANAAIVLSPAGRLVTAPHELVIAQSFFFAPFGAAVFASMAAWYRRFLNLANPNRSQRPAKPQRGRGDLPTNSRTAASRRS